MTLIKTTRTRIFDPYNVVLLRAYSQLDSRVLVHSADIAHVHCIPNLLRLKRDLRVLFMVYDTVEDVKCGNLKSIFPRGGLVVIDTGTLIGCPSGTLISSIIYYLKLITPFVLCILAFEAPNVQFRLLNRVTNGSNSHFIIA